MKTGSAVGRQQTPPQPHLTAKYNSFLLIRSELSSYSHEKIYWLDRIDQLCHKSRPLLHQIISQEPVQWLQRVFNQRQGRTQLTQLIEYYRFYRNSPILSIPFYIDFMFNYWSRTKSLYYKHIKRQLNIDQQISEETMERNICQDTSPQTDSYSHTFYILDQIQNTSQLADSQVTLRKILKNMHMKFNSQSRGLKQIDKAYEFHKSKQKSQPKSSQKTYQKTQSKANPIHMVSISSFKKTKTKKSQPKTHGNHKSLSNETQLSHQRPERARKLITMASTQGLNHPETTLNYCRRDLCKQSKQKPQIKMKKRESTIKNETKLVNRGRSSQKSSQGKSKSTKKRGQVQNTATVKAMIDKVKNKIKVEKTIMLKKIGESRQSHTKSIDSTCGEIGKNLHRK